MKNTEDSIDIKFLDHVAIRVKDLQTSVQWYQDVLGLRKVHPKEWGDFPIFMMVNKTGIALFPANSEDPVIDLQSKNVKIDHFAFQVDHENFEKAIKRYKELDLDYHIQDHIHFKSIYTRDPDQHIVELTTIMVDEGDFYKE